MTDREQEIIAAARRGTWVGAGGGPSVADLATTDDPARWVRADLIRDLLLGRHGELDPRGVRITGMRVVGQLDLDHVTTTVRLELTACALPEPISCRQARLRDLVLDDSQLAGLVANGLHTDGRLQLRNVFVHGSAEDGVVRLVGARIGSQLDLTGAKITNTTGTALNADGVRIGDDLTLLSATLHGTGPGSALRLVSAHVDDQVDLDEVEISNATGTAVNADDLHTGGNLFLGNATLSGVSPDSAVRLLGARIGGDWRVRGTRIKNPSGLLLHMRDTRVAGMLNLPATLVCPTGAVVSRNHSCPHADRRFVVDGLEFGDLNETSWRQWLHLLINHTPAYRPQPFQQLAAAERSAGHDNNARNVLIAQQEDLRRRQPDAIGGWLARARHRLWGWLGRYGYRAHRLVTVLALVLILAGALGYTAGQVPTRPGHHAAERVQPTGTPASAPRVPCSTAELIGLGIDRGLPLGGTGLRARCDLDTGTRRGQAFTYVIWVLQAFVWALATLAIAAYTGLVRKPA